MIFALACQTTMQLNINNLLITHYASLQRLMDMIVSQQSHRELGPPPPWLGSENIFLSKVFLLKERRYNAVSSYSDSSGGSGPRQPNSNKKIIMKQFWNGTAAPSGNSGLLHQSLVCSLAQVGVSYRNLLRLFH
jgi:hypothetical protein